MVAVAPEPQRVWTGATRTFTLTIGWGYITFVVVLAAVSTLAALIV